MHIDLNLAKSPFRNRSLFWLGMTAILLVALTAFLLVVTRAASVNTDTGTLREQLDKQEATIKDLQTQVDEIQNAKASTVFSDVDRRALDDARKLLIQRSFSWSRLFGDLEPSVPTNVKLTAIEVEDFAGDGPNRTATLLITGRGKDFGQLSTFMANLDSTGGRFSADPVENGPVNESPEFEFVVRVRYRPFIGVETAPAPAEAKTDA